MSLSNVRPYFRTHLNALGFSEWKDPFNVENIPSNLLNKAYNIEVNQASVRQHNMTDLVISWPVTLRIFHKGYRDVTTGLDSAITDSETVLNRLLKPEYRIATTLKNLVLSSISYDPIAISNDNAIVTSIIIEALVILNPN